MSPFVSANNKKSSKVIYKSKRAKDSNRGNPNGTSTRGEPEAAYEGDFCLLTQNGNGNFDIDGGCTTITTPVIDATDPGSIIKYAR